MSTPSSSGSWRSLRHTINNIFNRYLSVEEDLTCMDVKPVDPPPVCLSDFLDSKSEVGAKVTKEFKKEKNKVNSSRQDPRDLLLHSDLQLQVVPNSSEFSLLQPHLNLLDNNSIAPTIKQHRDIPFIGNHLNPAKLRIPIQSAGQSTLPGGASILPLAPQGYNFSVIPPKRPFRSPSFAPLADYQRSPNISIHTCVLPDLKSPVTKLSLKAEYSQNLAGNILEKPLKDPTSDYYERLLIQKRIGKLVRSNDPIKPAEYREVRTTSLPFTVGHKTNEDRILNHYVKIGRKSKSAPLVPAASPTKKVVELPLPQVPILKDLVQSHKRVVSYAKYGNGRTLDTYQRKDFSEQLSLFFWATDGTSSIPRRTSSLKFRNSPPDLKSQSTKRDEIPRNRISDNSIESRSASFSDVLGPQTEEALKTPIDPFEGTPKITELHRDEFVEENLSVSHDNSNSILPNGYVTAVRNGKGSSINEDKNKRPVKFNNVVGLTTNFETQTTIRSGVRSVAHRIWHSLSRGRKKRSLFGINHFGREQYLLPEFSVPSQQDHLSLTKFVNASKLASSSSKVDAGSTEITKSYADAVTTEISKNYDTTIALNQGNPSNRVTSAYQNYPKIVEGIEDLTEIRFDSTLGLIESNTLFFRDHKQGESLQNGNGDITKKEGISNFPYRSDLASSDDKDIGESFSHTGPIEAGHTPVSPKEEQGFQIYQRFAAFAKTHSLDDTALAALLYVVRNEVDDVDK